MEAVYSALFAREDWKLFPYIEDHCFIWQPWFATSYRPLYGCNLAHSTERLNAQRSSGRKWQIMTLYLLVRKVSNSVSCIYLPCLRYSNAPCLRLCLTKSRISNPLLPTPVRNLIIIIWLICLLLLTPVTPKHTPIARMFVATWLSGLLLGGPITNRCRPQWAHPRAPIHTGFVGCKDFCPGVPQNLFLDAKYRRFF